MYHGLKNITLQNEINCQIIWNDDVVKLNPIPSEKNRVNVKHKFLEWFSARKYKVTASRLASLIGLPGKPKYDLLWKVVKESKSDLDITFIKKNIRGN